MATDCTGATYLKQFIQNSHTEIYRIWMEASVNWYFLAFQLIFTPLSYPGIRIGGAFLLNMYTAPAYFACIMNLAGSLALIYCFTVKFDPISTTYNNLQLQLGSVQKLRVRGHYLSNFRDSPYSVKFSGIYPTPVTFFEFF